MHSKPCCPKDVITWSSLIDLGVYIFTLFVVVAILCGVGLCGIGYYTYLEGKRDGKKDGYAKAYNTGLYEGCDALRTYVYNLKVGTAPFSWGLPCADVIQGARLK